MMKKRRKQRSVYFNEDTLEIYGDVCRIAQQEKRSFSFVVIEALRQFAKK